MPDTAATPGRSAQVPETTEKRTSRRLDQGPETDEKTPPQCRACHYDHHNECEDDRCVCK
jgi:hypothetical protein